MLTTKENAIAELVEKRQDKARKMPDLKGNPQDIMKTLIT
jgi:hypothetical protein